MTQEFVVSYAGPVVPAVMVLLIATTLLIEQHAANAVERVARCVRGPGPGERPGVSSSDL